MAILTIDTVDVLGDAAPILVTISLTDIYKNEIDAFTSASVLAASFGGYTDASGHLEVDLIPNADISSPLNTVYLVDVGGYEYIIIKNNNPQTLFEALAATPANLTAGVVLQGATGPQGTLVRYGVVAPTAGVGNNGDFYINTSSSTLYGPKAAGVWPAGVSLIGATGLTGPVGPQGVTGASGATGAAGAAGATGPSGVSISATAPVSTSVLWADTTVASFNFTGPQGAQGVQGAIGPQGSASTVAGPQGFQGDIGSQGPQGNQGVVGAQGDQGAVGAQGNAGAQGNQGVTGAQGPQGDTGAQGAVGAQGVQGASGPQGNQGNQGAQGSTTIGTAIDITAATSTSIPMIVRGAASQSANLSEWRNSAGGALAVITPGGMMAFDGASAFRVALYSDAGGPNILFGQTSQADFYSALGVNGGVFQIKSNFNGTRVVRAADGLVFAVRGMATQTNNLQEWQNSSGTALASVNSAGGARFVPRVTTITSSGTPTVNTDNTDAVTITAQAAAITSMTTNLTGTPNNFDKLTIRIKDDGTARAITWGAKFVASGVALPTTTVINKVTTVGFIYDTVKAAWGCVACVVEL